jgi:uncharacterized membrane protein
MMSFTLLLGALDSNNLLRLLGRFHPAIVHFPIALLAVAAVFEVWQVVRRKPGLSPATAPCLVLGAVSAIVASALGFLFDDGGGELVELHKWVGIASTAAAFLAAVLVRMAASSPGALMTLRVLLFAGATLVGGTGYLGGELVFGRNHLWKGIFDEPKPAQANIPDLAVASTVPPAGLLVAKAPADPASGNVDFAKDVAPILKEYCVRCHNIDKTKGKLNLQIKTKAFAGGASGVVIEPKAPDKSALYTALISKEDDTHMPPPEEKKQPSMDHIATIRKWIEQGAVWPDGVEVK